MTAPILKIKARKEGTRIKIEMIACGSEEMRKIVSALGPSDLGAPQFVIRKEMPPLLAETFAANGVLLGVLWVCGNGHLHCKSTSDISWRQE